MAAPQSENTLYELVAYEAEDDGMSTYPVALARHRLGIFTTIDSAEHFMTTAVHGGHTFVDPADLLRLHLFAFRVDEELHYREVRVYEPAGQLVGREDFYADGDPPPFKGRPGADCRFQPGDLAQFIPGSDLARLHLGIISARPLSPAEVAAQLARNPDLQLDVTDDVYLVLYFLDNDLAHDQVPEYQLAPPRFALPPGLSRRLRQAYAEQS